MNRCAALPFFLRRAGMRPRLRCFDPSPTAAYNRPALKGCGADRQQADESGAVAMNVTMGAATRRNAVLGAIGAALLLLLWQIPGRQGQGSGPVQGLGTPRPTPTVQSDWRPLQQMAGDGSQDLCAGEQWIRVPGPWRLRREPAYRDVLVRVLDRHDHSLFARVWAAGSGHGALATLPQGNGTFCLQIEADGPYTLYVEVWEAPHAGQ